jgi:hypothetical protein
LKKKKAIITVELVAESAAEEDEKIVSELLEWFREDAICVPWVKDVKDIVVKEN